MGQNKSRGDRLCAQRKSKTENKQNETAGINETNQMIKRSTKQKIVQDNS